MASGSSKTSAAVSKLRPCDRRFARFLSGSQVQRNDLAFTDNYDIVVTSHHIVKVQCRGSSQRFCCSPSPMDETVTVSVGAPGGGKCPYDLGARAALQEAAASEWREAWRFRGTGARRRYCTSDWMA